jgi:hypothetical protein
MSYIDNSMAIWESCRLLPCCSISRLELMMCECWSSAPESNGIAYGLWLVMYKRASWYENTETWSRSTLHWQSTLDTRSCDWYPTTLHDDNSCIDHITCSWYVKLQVFMGFRGYQSRWGSQILLQVFESLLCLLSPLELVLFLEELKEWEFHDTESWDESAQGGHTSNQFLDIMEALRQLHLGDSRHLLWVRVNTTPGDHIPE